MGGGQNTYNPLKNKGRNKKIITIIIFLILIVVSISFALFNPSINLLGRRNIKISKCELDINFKESDELMLVSKYPISTRQALEGGYKPKTVTITNNSTCDMAYYKLTIKDLINSSINKDIIQYHVVDKQNTMTYKLGDVNNDGKINILEPSSINKYIEDNTSKFDTIASARYAGDVDDDGKITPEDLNLILDYYKKLITTFPAGTPLEEKTTTKEIINVNPDTFLIENSLEKGKTHEYEIIMWISNAATNNDLYVNGDTTKPIEYKYALNIEATDEKKEDAEIVPILNIPVGTNGIEKVTHEIDDTLQVDSRFTTEYRYRGGDSVVNNYVSFNNETWRIIGVIPTEDTNGNVENRIKIVNVNLTTNRKWDDNGINDWTTATLNTYLNNTYYNTLSNTAKNMIGTTKYYLTSGTSTQVTIDNFWQNERKKDTTMEEYHFSRNQIMQADTNKKIALMYASDYGYAASKKCLQQLYAYKDDSNCITENNWMDKSQMTWTIVPSPSDHQKTWVIVPDGSTIPGNADYGEFAVLPVLTLSSNVKISSGSGTSSDPYQLQLN